MTLLRQGSEGQVSLHRVSLAGFLRALAPRDKFGRGGRPASLLVGAETFFAAHRGCVLSSAELIGWLYGDAEDGGPLDAMDCLRTTISRLRKRGVPIVTHGKRGYMLRAEL